uniref:NADP-dependent oxidoreductase domain-containing protein n=1 Tax=Glossina pallidipes TaxID=7398 RepID=A0A1A9Z6U4_GLOPL
MNNIFVFVGVSWKLRHTLKTVDMEPLPKDCSENPTAFELNNGMQIPFLGFATAGLCRERATRHVYEAVKVGYRLIDCAYLYQNEGEDLFITSKLWNTFHRPECIEKAICTTLKDLRLKYLDLYLMHWPMGYQEGGDLIPRDACGKVKFSDVDFVDTWQAMEKLVEGGVTKSIGLMNFNKRQIERILDICSIPPVVNQVECHPYLTQAKLKAYCKKQRILLICYCPLGSLAHPHSRRESRVLDHDWVKRLSYKHEKSAAQILIRYQIQRGNGAIPMAATKAEIMRNFDVFDWCLDKKDMEDLDSMNQNKRFVSLVRGGPQGVGRQQFEI